MSCCKECEERRQAFFDLTRTLVKRRVDPNNPTPSEQAYERMQWQEFAHKYPTAKNS